ncbi:uncharacterized protein [Pyrus communis]|uniref:uncharacterized protein isoform X1 n=1 Tax=Pyrus communis TaxID=23211 RepID=UPI0035BFBDB6
MLFLLKTCHKFKARRDLESKTEQLLHSEMTPTTQQTQLLQFQLQFLKKVVFTTIQDTLEFITTKGQIFLPWKLLKLGTSLVSKLYIQLYLACSKLCLTGILSILHL